MTNVMLSRARTVVMCSMLIYCIVSITMGVLSTLGIASTTITIVNNVFSLLYLLVGIPWSMYHVIRMQSIIKEMKGNKISSLLHRKNMLLAAINCTLVIMIIALVLFAGLDARAKVWLYYGMLVGIIHAFLFY